ncbi:hypothetical protein R3P38DRAFT_3446022 [Favolaschia claudopus]|uniref:DUF6532 domain-containing protein n=1 Tax=Favolaschia claudopus TaxID=2862362 RepID=A0AAV9ZMX8_9AGAR
MELTALEFCVKQWSTGSFIASKFTEKAVVDSYEKYVKDVEKWSAMKPSVVENIRKKCTGVLREFIDHLVTSSNASFRETLTSEVINDNESSINDAQEEALRAELEGRTGDTDSEDEGGDEDKDDEADVNDAQ